MQKMTDKKKSPLTKADFFKITAIVEKQQEWVYFHVKYIFPYLQTVCLSRTIFQFLLLVVERI